MKPRLTLRQFNAMIEAEKIYNDTDHVDNLSREETWRLIRSLYEIILEKKPV